MGNNDQYLLPQTKTSKTKSQKDNWELSEKLSVEFIDANKIYKVNNCITDEFTTVVSKTEKRIFLFIYSEFNSIH